MPYFRNLLLTNGFLFLLVIKVFAFQADSGIPYIQNIAPNEYQGEIQNWHAAQLHSGIMYIANLGGVLEYDGESWRNINLPNTIALSVGVYNDTVFVGGVNEIGFLYSPTQDSAHFQYRSLKSRLSPFNQEFGDVWQAIPTSEGIYFRTSRFLFKYNNGTIKSWESDNGFHFAFDVREELYVNIRGIGLHKMVGNKLQMVDNGEIFAEDGVYAMLPYGDNSVLLATRFQNLVILDDNQIRAFETKANKFLEENRLYNGITLNDGTYVFGTTQGGIIHIDQKGYVLNIINKDKGLLSDVVYHLFEDKEGNLWVSQNEGLSIVNIQSPVSILDDRYGLEGMPKAMHVDDEQFFVGTTHGLFHRNENYTNLFENITSNKDDPLDFLKVNEKLMYVSSGGVMEITDGGVEAKLSQRYTSCIKKSSIHPGVYYLCTRNGLYLVRENRNELINLGKIEGIDSEVNSVAEDSEGNVWASAPTVGIYQLSWDGSEDSILQPKIVKRVTQKNRPKVFEVGEKVLFGFEETFMSYHSERDTLVDITKVEGPSLSAEGAGIFLMAQDSKENLWMRANNQTTKAVLLEDGTYKEQTTDLNLIKSDQYNFIYPDDKGNVWFGTEDGLIRYDTNVAPRDHPDYKTFVREVLVRNDSLVYSGPRPTSSQFTFEYQDNELRFQYAAPTFTRTADTEYQVYLEGLDSRWSNWTSESHKDYTNIPEGDYIFHVRARNVHGKISEAGTFSFTVLPPWYRTWWAYSLYLLLIGGAVYGIHRFRINRILREQRIRNRIASDLHDEVSATLSSITYFAQAIRQTQNGSKSERFVGLISESASDAKEKITDIIWSIDPENDDWVNLLAKCRRFASDLFESKDMDYDLDIDTDINRPLDIELRQHLWLIYKEMVVNAARHSGARKVDISFGLKGNTLRLVVQDNGKGMSEESQNRSGHGIKNIKKRAGQIGAELQLETDSNIGTRWIMTLKMR